MDATIGDNPVVARSENKFLSSGNTEKNLPFPRSANFPPATNAQLRSTSSSVPKFSHFQNPRGGVNHFRSQATKKGFLSGHSASRTVLETEFCERNESPPVQWNNHLPSAVNAALLSKQSSPLNALFNAAHSSSAVFPPSQSQLFSERVKILNFLPAILGACANLQIAVIYAAPYTLTRYTCSVKSKVGVFCFQLTASNASEPATLPAS